MTVPALDALLAAWAGTRVGLGFPVGEVGSCLGATRVAVDALRLVGVRAEPVAVEVIAFNAASSVHSGLLHGDVVQPMDAFRALCVEGGDARTTVADESGVSRWAGHLVVVVDRVLVDLTADQFGDVAAGFVYRPFVATVPRQFERGATVAFRQEPGGLLLVARSAESAWRASPAWRRDYGGAAKQLAAAVERRLA